MPVLVVNVDHVATIRQQRHTHEPEPVTAAHLAELGGARGIIVHLREDRRHIQDRDVELISRTLNTRLHFEMAATEEMQKIALQTKPYMVCLVPEKREELTTEGGLVVQGRETFFKDFLAPIHEQGAKSSLFIEADRAQIDAVKQIGCEFIEIHTGHYADAKTEEKQLGEFLKIVDAIEYANSIGLKVNLGHGLNYTNVQRFKNISGIAEYSIGHSIISRAVLVGMQNAVREMHQIISTFAD